MQPEPATYTVPTEAMRRGDFSEFSNQLRPGDGDQRRRAIAVSEQPDSRDRIDRVAAAYAALSGCPIVRAPSATTTNQLRPYDYNAGMGRVDHTTDTNRLFVTTYWNKRQEDRYNWAQDAANATDGGVINGFEITKGFDYRTNRHDRWLHRRRCGRISCSTSAAAGRVSASIGIPRPSSIPSLGFSAAALRVMGDYNYLPLMTLGTFSTTNENSTIASLGIRRSTGATGSTGRSIPIRSRRRSPACGESHASGRLRPPIQEWEITNNGFPGGRFQFNGSYTRANNTAALNDRAQSWAQFLLGLPTSATGVVATPATQSSQFEIASPGSFTQVYHHFFVQDDWRVSPKLTANLGLRLEINSGMSESSDRNLAGFDTVTSNPIEPTAIANYALNPIPRSRCRPSRSRAACCSPTGR